MNYLIFCCVIMFLSYCCFYVEQVKNEETYKVWDRAFVTIFSGIFAPVAACWLVVWLLSPLLHNVQNKLVDKL